MALKSHIINWVARAEPDYYPQLALVLQQCTQPFPTEAKRMEFLFELYEKYTADLFTKEKVKKKKKEKA